MKKSLENGVKLKEELDRYKGWYERDEELSLEWEYRYQVVMGIAYEAAKNHEHLRESTKKVENKMTVLEKHLDDLGEKVEERADDMDTEIRLQVEHFQSEFEEIVGLLQPAGREGDTGGGNLIEVTGAPPWWWPNGSRV